MARQSNADYWAVRIKLMQDALLDESYSYVENLERQFDIAIAELERQIAAWYQRFAENNDITLAEAKRLLNTRELKEFHWSVGEYIAYGEQNALDGAWMKQLENASARAHISRLDSLKLQIQQQAEALFANQLDAVDAAVRTIYESSYYHTAFEVQRGLGVGWSLQSINEEAIKKALSRPWTADGLTFRDRCWTDKQKLVSTVNTQLTQMIIRGEAPDRAIAAISKQFEVSKSKAGRLVMTESAYFSSAAQKDSFNALDVELYKNVAALDGDTCNHCGAMDGKVFKMSEYQVGLTAPPYHPWCRCCTAPYFEDMKDVGERFARDVSTGERYKVPADMTFEEWKARQSSKSQPSTKPLPKADYTASTRANVINVTEEYFKKATPGKGAILYDDSYGIGKHREEIATAQMLHEVFGGDIRLLSESTIDSVKTPDYLWRNKLWELKSTTSVNGADKSLQRAIKQIQGNPGGVILNLLADTDYDKLHSQLLSRFSRSSSNILDIMLLSKGKFIKVLRYKK